MSMNMENRLREYLSNSSFMAIEEACKAAEKFKVNIYLVGGPVRDLLLCIPIKDIDITVEGNAVDFVHFLQMNSDCKIISIQENLKTAKVKFFNSVYIDFASTREEKYKINGHLPIAFNFGCHISLDVKRRDFTVNTLVIKLSGANKFTLTDYYNAQYDLLKREIKVLHEKSFEDDPSRIVRAVKFKKRLNFEYETNTRYLMQKYLSNVNSEIPLERIKNELKSYFSTKKYNLYNEIIETNTYKLLAKNPILQIDENSFCELEEKNLFNSTNKWFIFMILLLVNEKTFSKHLNLTSVEKKSICDTKELLESSIPKDNFEIYKLLKNKNNLTISAYYLITKNSYILKYINELAKTEILINGKDLIELGLVPSKYFGKIFDLLLKEKIEGRIKSKEEEINFVKKLISSNQLNL